VSLAALFVLALALVEAAGVSQQQAESFSRKLSIIEQHATDAARSGAAPRRTPVTEAEVNSWFAYRSAEALPTGVTQPRITIVGNRQVVGTATVDLDAVAKSRASGRVFDVWNLVGGRVPLTVTGLVHASGGRGRFEMQRAEMSGVPIPRRMIEELVDYYSRTPDDPDGVRLDQEFELPAGIQRIDLAPGTAVVVQ
jgi:hypothetical protein